MCRIAKAKTMKHQFSDCDKVINFCEIINENMHYRVWIAQVRFVPIVAIFPLL